MNKRIISVMTILLTLSLLLSSCGLSENTQGIQSAPATESEISTVETSEPDLSSIGEANAGNAITVTPSNLVEELEAGFSAVGYAGDYWLDGFLEQGGASSDAQVVEFLARNFMTNAGGVSPTAGFGCSTLSVASPDGDALFGRNFDWQHCDALVITSTPENGYSSIATVNMSFLDSFGIMDRIPEWAKPIVALYAPLDGMNDQGFCAAVNMIQDSAVIEQNTDKPDLTTTTAIRMLLDKAATVDEALSLLEQYDMHSSMGMMVHFALADKTGRSVAVEYVGGEMIVIETPAVTNFYLADGEKQGVGTAQSHTRYNNLMDQLAETPTMSMSDVRNALSSVSKKNFGEFESTEWSIVYNQSKGEVWYYHRENYENSYIFHLPQD